MPQSQEWKLGVLADKDRVLADWQVDVVFISKLWFYLWVKLCSPPALTPSWRVSKTLLSGWIGDEREKGEGGSAYRSLWLQVLIGAFLELFLTMLWNVWAAFWTDHTFCNIVRIYNRHRCYITMRLLQRNSKITILKTKKTILLQKKSITLNVDNNNIFKNKIEKEKQYFCRERVEGLLACTSLEEWKINIFSKVA